MQNNIVLVGLMGAGKTTIGRLLAKAFSLPFVDSDHEIEARTGVKVPIIFEIEGEEGFRLREAHVVAELAQRQGLVIATGGGAVLNPASRTALHDCGVVVYLHAQPNDLWLRTRHDQNRPLLRATDPLARRSSAARSVQRPCIDWADAGHAKATRATATAPERKVKKNSRIAYDGAIRVLRPVA